jgi:hypothetical protein
MSAAATDTANTFITENSDGSYDIDVGDLDDLSTADVTCENFEAQFSEDVCDLANCCPNCIDEFEAVAECIINEVIFDQLLDSEETCDVECGTNGGLNVPGKSGGRLLADLPPPPGDGNSPPQGDGELPPPFRLLDKCRTEMAAYIAIGVPEKAYEAYFGCLMDGISKVGHGTQTEAPTTDDSEGIGGGVSGFAGSLILFQTVMAFGAMFG